MWVEVLRHWISNGEEYGEYYVCNGNNDRHLCFQNGNDIKLIPHYRGRSVEKCISSPTSKVIDAISQAIKGD